MKTSCFLRSWQTAHLDLGPDPSALALEILRWERLPLAVASVVRPTSV